MSVPAHLAEGFRRWIESPATFVRQVFKAEPDVWQAEVLEKFNTHPRQAMTACKGPGKSTVLAWLGWYFLVTRMDSKVVAVSITADTLADTLWAELGKWFAATPILKNWFDITATSIVSKERPQTWGASARAFSRNANPQQQADTLAGIHGEHVLVLLDEAGGIPRGVLATAEAVLSSGGDQHIVMAGNPTNQDSALGYAVLNNRHLWDVTEITGDPDDPKRASRVSAEWARQQIEAWGRDNPWVLVNVFGRFPPSGLNTLLTPDEVRDAQKRQSPNAEYLYQDFPLVFGVDVARFGDDETVIFPRRGKIAYPPMRMRNLDNIQVASRISLEYERQKASSIQVEADGLGGGVKDALSAMGHTEALGVISGGKAADERRFKNRRAENFFKTAEWVKDGGMLPNIPEMVIGLSSIQYTLALDGRIQIEEKAQIKARLGRSPDLEDALGCTFAYPVHVVRKTLHGYPELSELIGQRSQTDYDPYTRGLGANVGDSFRG